MPLFPCWQCHAWSGCERICEPWLPWAPACVFSPASSLKHLFLLYPRHLSLCFPLWKFPHEPLWLILDPTTCIRECFQLHRRMSLLCPCSMGFILVKNTLIYVKLCYCQNEESIPPTKPMVFILILFFKKEIILLKSVNFTWTSPFSPPQSSCESDTKIISTCISSAKIMWKDTINTTEIFCLWGVSSEVKIALHIFMFEENLFASWEYLEILRTASENWAKLLM